MWVDVVGRNGKGKSTLLKWIAARREGCNSQQWRTSTIHYVTQELHLEDEVELYLPVQFVLEVGDALP
jgi:ATP-binding cassette subfamily F protein 3